ncbi:MAG: hypothetical protein RR280_01180 [Bacteroidaceae bacterium]
MDKITPPPFPLNAFKDFISTTIGVGIVYKDYQDKFLRRDVQEMYLGAKWVWSCLTRNFESRITKIAEGEIEKTLQFNGRKHSDYTPNQLKSMLDVKRKYLADNHTKVLKQLFDSQIFDDCETTFIASTSLMPMLPRGNGKASFMQAMTEDALEQIKEQIANAPVTPSYEGVRNAPCGHKHVLVLRNRPHQILSYIKRHTTNDDYVQKHVKLLNDKDNFMET